MPCDDDDDDDDEHNDDDLYEKRGFYCKNLVLSTAYIVGYQIYHHDPKFLSLLQPKAHFIFEFISTSTFKSQAL